MLTTLVGNHMHLSKNFPRPPIYTNDTIDKLIQENGGLFCIPENGDQFLINIFQYIDMRLTRHIKFIESEYYGDKPKRISFAFLCES